VGSPADRRGSASPPRPGPSQLRPPHLALARMQERPAARGGGRRPGGRPDPGGRELLSGLRRARVRRAETLALPLAAASRVIAVAATPSRSRVCSAVRTRTPLCASMRTWLTRSEQTSRSEQRCRPYSDGEGLTVAWCSRGSFGDHGCPPTRRALRRGAAPRGRSPFSREDVFCSEVRRVRALSCDWASDARRDCVYEERRDCELTGAIGVPRAGVLTLDVQRILPAVDPA
jgi:hypothetical protein